MAKKTKRLKRIAKRLSDAEIESRYQAHLAKIRGGK